MRTRPATLTGTAPSLLLAASAAALLAGAGASPAHGQQQEAPADLLDLASGTLVLDYSGQYSEGWGAMMLIDATTGNGWSSPEGSPHPHHFVLELPRRHRLDTLVLDNEGAQESGYPGISARTVEVLASVEGPEGPWEAVTTVEAAKGGRTAAPLPEGTEARWLKLVVRDNWGHETYTELMEVGARGEPVGEPPEHPPLEGVYETNWDELEFRRRGSRIVGCYDGTQGRLIGDTDGRVARFEWIAADGGSRGTALMALAADGSHLNGYWYQNGTYQGLWYGQRVEGEELELACDVSLEGRDLEAALDRGEGAILYGLHFAFDSDRLRDRSRETLRQVLDVLRSRPELRVRLVGHTDAVGGADYNRELSRRRAASVRRWLVEHDVEPERLEAEGRGEAEPVADNDTPQGRSLNRRVEIVPLERSGSS